VLFKNEGRMADESGIQRFDADLFGLSISNIKVMDPQNDAAPPPLPNPVFLDAAEKHARTWGMFCHLSGLAGCFLPWIAHLAGPLLVWLVKRNDHPAIDANGKEALNFQISMALYSALGCMLLAVTVVGIFAIPFFLGVLYVLNILGAVVGAIRASDGKFFRFPFTLRFLK
jgi:uncharacterized Tic20 family protein